MPDGHDGGGVWKDMPALLQTGFDADQVLARWKLDAAVKNRNAVVERSDDAARFLCEFVYYTSLAWFRTRSGRPASSTSRLPVVFLHVPEDLVKAGKIQEGRDVTLALIRALADSYSL